MEMKHELRKLLSGLAVEQVLGSIDTTFTGITYDSRRAKPGDLFVCIEGFRQDGHDFIPEAIEKGCTGVVVQKEEPVPEGVTMVRVSDTRLALAHLSAAFYNYPSRKLRLIGVTGTNGKTTTTHLIEAILRQAGYKTGLIGTIHNRIGEETLPVERTTPESLDLQELFARMVEAGVDYCVMEVSSHALSLERVACCEFDLGVFTNLTQDHLDFHNTISDYLAAKEKLFTLLGLPTPKKGTRAAVINVDDPGGREIAGRCPVPWLGYGLGEEADLRAVSVQIGSRGVKFTACGRGREIPLTLKLTGMFSVYNALAAIGVGLTEGIDPQVIARALAAVPGVPGRFESIDEGQDFSVIVDYAHTPDGLENILKAAAEFVRGRRIIVFGCGGDRDRTKRPIMGKIAAENADYVIITSDNPRSEDPLAIIADIEPGVKAGGKSGAGYEIIPDRKEAIAAAIAIARKDDMVILAGKGHETYQIIGNRTLPFDDREVAREALRRKI
ncbi:MAG: UDP-N-acetylmuramoyl-L-alanyl-D-glutamate--2,6-diaminopimelate ligase [bacterium]|jgi:UDP-N-acetylmuramoyl-L-alanyl-D-glutamate--2,6-diaminopimelate ligase